MGFVDSRDDTGRIQPGEWRRIVVLEAGCFQPPRPAHGTRYKNETTEMTWKITWIERLDPYQLSYVRPTGQLTE